MGGGGEEKKKRGDEERNDGVREGRGGDFIKVGCL